MRPVANAAERGTHLQHTQAFGPPPELVHDYPHRRCHTWVRSADGLKEADMYIARFSYSVLPINRQRAIDFIRREVKAAQHKQLNARLLVPLTRGQGGAALQFEVELPKLDQFDQFRERGIE